MPRMLPLLTLLLLHTASQTTAQETLVVRVQSGRQFRGTIDAASNDEQLVLFSSAGGMSIRRPIRWERVVGGQAGERPLSVAELKRLAAEAGPLLRGQELGIRQRETGDRVQGTGVEQEVVVLPSVASIVFDAAIANWDGDVETDGLVLDLLPLDAEGRIVPANGTVEVELFAAQRRTLHHAPLSGGDTLERVERWTQAVNVADAGPNGVRLRLPFGAVHPELDYRWLAYNYGLVHVRFAAPGSGVFDASQDGVRIRPWTPNRDYLEMNTGRRFLPTENLGRRD